MGRIEKTVFLSYRRTNASWALAIFQNLTHHGYDVFFDFNGIASGDFERVILGNIAARAHFLVLLTPSALREHQKIGLRERHYFRGRWEGVYLSNAVTMGTLRETDPWVNTLQPPPQAGKRQSIPRKILGGIVGGVGGFYVGFIVGAAIEGGRDALNGPMIGAPVGAVAGSILGYKFLF